MNLQRRLLLLAAYCLLPSAFCFSQSANATLMGRLTSQGDSKPLRGAMVIYRNQRTNSAGYVHTNSEGLYILEALQPGRYEVGAGAQGFRPALRPDVELTVGARVEISFSLEAILPSPLAPPTSTLPAPGPRGKTTSSGFLDAVYGPDAQAPQPVMIDLPAPLTETLVGQISTVVDERKILELPSLGVPYSANDLYTLIILQAGVTSDSATSLGLGFSVDGQRRVGSNFLLDGVDNNDLVVGGPAARISTDAVQEFRLTTNNFSAEFGRATAFITNVVTRTGTSAMHGTAFEFFNHDRLNANSFSNNSYGAPRAPLHQNQFGGTVGGPIRHDRAFFFGAFERAYLSSLGFDQPSNVPGFESPIYVPSRSFIARLRDGTIAKKLLTQFAPPHGTPVRGYPDAESLSHHYPLLQRNTLFVGRADYGAPEGHQRFTVRFAFSQSTTDDFLPSIYPDLSASLLRPADNLSVNYTNTVFLRGVNELKFGLNHNRIGFDRPHPEIPTLSSFDGVSLPGSEAAYAYSFRDRVLHVVDNFSVLRGKHSLVTGFEWRQDRDRSNVSIARDGRYVFDSLQGFAVDDPSLLFITVDRLTGKALDASAYERDYSQKEFAGFFQDNWKIARRLTLNLGLRYEYFGVPARQDGPADRNVFYGAGSNRTERLAAGGFRRDAPYSPDRNNFAPRFGFAWDLRGGGKTVLRGGYGISFDRIFNNIWSDVRNNSLAFVILSADLRGRRDFKYAFPARDGLPPSTPDLGTEVSVQVDQNLRTPYAQSWFLGVQQQITANLVVEVNHAGSLGRKLLALDQINRILTYPTDRGNDGRIHPKLGDISYRGNQGASDYVSLQASARQRLSRGIQFQISYTYSRNRDNQSDPFRNPVEANHAAPAFTRLDDPGLFSIRHATFTQQFNSSLDRGLSDFDQTQNLVFNLIAQSRAAKRFPYWAQALARGWQLSLVAGFRSGFPFTVLASGHNTFYSSFGILNRNRANLATGESLQSAFFDPAKPGPGGLYLLDLKKFKDPAIGQVGTLPRNAFRGPGFWNADLGISRSFVLRLLGEAGRVQFRAEFFNLFNHANLGDPNARIGSGTFGLARFGRQGFSGSLPSVSALSEQPRRIQFGLKFYF